MPDTEGIRACPENPKLPDLIGVVTESKGENPETGGVIVPAAARRSIVVHGSLVPTGGLAEKFVLEALGLTADQVRPLYNDVLGSPRDYGYLISSIVFTEAGGRRLAEHFGIDLVFDDEPFAADVVQTVHARAKKHPKAWWQRDLEDES